MAYSPGIIMMAQNLLGQIANDSDIDESRFYMLWNSILAHHFPSNHSYGVALQKSATILQAPAFFVVKIVRAESESVVLVVGLQKPSEDTEAGRLAAQAQLEEYIEECSEDTEFDTIYAIAGIGLSWAAFKMEVSDAQDLEVVQKWTSNVIAVASCEEMDSFARIIDRMTGARRP